MPAWTAGEIGLLAANLRLPDILADGYAAVGNFWRSVSPSSNTPADFAELSSRFEFSMLPADGGNIKPHTDAPQKLITLVFSMVLPGEWNPTWGGGTDMDLPRDERRTYNQTNEWLEFDDVAQWKTFSFEPNQCVAFVKTFNSLHCVPPMTGPEGAMRRTLTLNIERAGYV